MTAALNALFAAADEPADMRVEFSEDGQAQDVRPARRLRYAAEARL